MTQKAHLTRKLPVSTDDLWRQLVRSPLELYVLVARRRLSPVVPERRSVDA